MGFGGRAGDMGKLLMRQMEEMQRKMERIQSELAAERIEASAGGGMVAAVVSGMGELREIHIKPEVVDPDEVEMLQDMITAAVSEALARAQSHREERMAELTGGLNLPGLGRLPGL